LFIVSLAMSYSALGQIAFQHNVAAAAAYSVIDDPSLNASSSRIVLVAHDFATLGPYVSAPVGVSYTAGRWRVQTLDGSNLPAGARFNVLSASASENAMVHTAVATNISGNSTAIDLPSLNSHPDARPLVTAVGTTNPHPVGVYYAGGRWRVFNQDLATMPENAKFHVYLDDRVIMAAATTPTAPTGNNFVIDHASANGKPGALVFTTAYWTSIYNPHNTGVWYTTGNWRIFNEDRVTMPAGAKFNVLALSPGDNTRYPPVTARSSSYDGVNAGVVFPPDTRYNSTIPITLEAWVYRKGGGACETFISNGYSGVTGSYWLGVCPNLRFYRSGGTFADSTAAIPQFKWTHVAVSYDGASARFYVNGEAAGVASLANAGLGDNHDLTLGRDSAGYPFKGHLDEVRIWRGTRSQTQIQQGMWEELRDEINLAAVFDTGGAYEVLSGLSGTALPILPEVSGLGILPKALRVPLARYPATLDGQIGTFGEYAGAERFVIRNPGSRADESGYLVHDGTRLFVAMENAALPAAGISDDQAFCSVHIDTDGSGASLAGPGSLRIAQTLSAIERLDAGNGMGGYQATGETTGTSWGANKGAASSEFSAANMEFFILLRRLATGPATAPQALAETDRFAFVQTGVQTTSDRYTWPGNAAYNSPSTWAPMTYSLDSAGAPLPKAQFRCRVVDASTGQPLASRNVRLSSQAGTIYARATTDSAGEINILRTVPAIPLQLQMEMETGELAESPVISEDFAGPAPTFPAAATAVYPAVTYGTVEFDKVQFSLRRAIGATAISGADTRVTVPVTVRGGATPKRHPGGRVTINGTNLHPYVEVYLARRTLTPLTTPLAGLTEGTDYWRATVASTGSGSLVFECPELPANQRTGRCFIVIRDTWIRPANPAASWTVGPAITLEDQPYPLLHGFEFTNLGDGHDMDDYRAAFPGQICDPSQMIGFWAFFPLYKLILDGGGECYGVSVASQQFSKGLAARDFRSDVLFANGFPSQPFTVDSVEVPRCADFPATFDVSNPCSPRPTNVWGRVRAWHGIQLSSEAIRETLSQFEYHDRVVTDLTDSLALMAPNPRNYHLCMRDGDKGHCVQPLKIVEEVSDAAGIIQPNRRQIEIYDPNHPGETRVIEVDLALNRYTYDGFSPMWSGSWMMIYRTDPLVSGNRHIPSIDALGAAIDPLGVGGMSQLLQMIVAGDAEVMATSPDGGQLGWNAAGDFVETSTESWPIPVFNWSELTVPPLGHHPVNMVHRLNNGAPDLAIRAHGSQYVFHGSNRGTIFQAFIGGALTGQTDALTFTRDGNAVDGIRLQPQASRTAKMLIALSPNEIEYPAAISVANVNIPGSASATLRVLPGSAGVEFVNDTGLAQTPSVEIALPLPKGTPGPSLKTPPALVVPAGAALRLRSPDGIDFSQWVMELDFERDGNLDRRWNYDTATGLRIELAAPDPVLPVLTLTRTQGGGKLTWIDTPGWVLTTSNNLQTWDEVSGTTVQQGTASYTFTIPGMNTTKLFFRLEKRTVGATPPATNGAR